MSKVFLINYTLNHTLLQNICSLGMQDLLNAWELISFPLRSNCSMVLHWLSKLLLNEASSILSDKLINSWVINIEELITAKKCVKTDSLGVLHILMSTNCNSGGHNYLGAKIIVLHSLSNYYNIDKKLFSIYENQQILIVLKITPTLPWQVNSIFF